MNPVREDVTKRPAVAVADEAQNHEWWRAVRVRDIVSSPAICVELQSTVTEAHALMQKHGVRRLPVLDEGKLVESPFDCN